MSEANGARHTCGAAGGRVLATGEPCPALVTAGEYLDARNRAGIDGPRRMWLDAELEGGVRYDPLAPRVAEAMR